MSGAQNILLAGGAAAWTPVNLGSALTAWYKADAGVYKDAGTTLASNTDTVQQWNDQSGNGYHLLQSSAGARPQYLSAGFNSKQTVNFTNASSTRLVTSVDTVAMGTGNVGSVFGVARLTTSGVANSRLISYLGNGSTADTTDSHSAAWIFVTQSTGTMASYRGGFFASDTGLFSPSTNYRFGNIYDNTNNTNYVNNSAGTPVAATALTWTSPGTLIVGTGDTITGAGINWDGPISELIITNTALSSGDRSSLDSYLVAKWGL